ncbi:MULTISPECIES: GNAT family N-acetyltransferase [Bacillales]|jgi:ribosomal protein S18 acetylase RimI-like enzyme|uniref:N-acetyltransferase domain-containing protein n=1 Tax=Brevibacillus aydinogluensis TaxID=927786 RepID=A0AA48MCV9_9BACL|nr:MULTISPECIES: GNAT family N-acetyltransferase [Bacillales]REK66722.1 MAG: GNAT family N-acetyltransferase [Brevibacillus sp.]MBR8660048.1 GNAT family N-acetyltransferase [Brevibacillus sp. NL20B1]MDT3417790.1 ribosomal protein S18 acetylase RimI-like enzyme [Brevibacillus aydinogluensis]NNV02212.1 GNAT family N-acetyltransferase [Brevibacillus sp. MCWH]UFJ62864.1 GNAT family N-acetyltransferase [Anoxybacillus sediminis]
MLIRPFRLGDYSAITRIWQETGLEESDTESLNDLAKQLAWDSDLVMVAEKDGEVVGVVVGTIDGSRAYFYRLAVTPRLQGTGIGRKLVEAIEKRFRQRGVHRVLIMVNQDNPEVLPFYYSLGYEMQKYVTLSKKLSS